MAALLLVLSITMAAYAWLLSPAVEATTALLRGHWLLWLPAVLLIWLMANRDP